MGNGNYEREKKRDQSIHTGVAAGWWEQKNTEKQAGKKKPSVRKTAQELQEEADAEYAKVLANLQKLTGFKPPANQEDDSS